MTLRLSAEIQMDADQARAELQATGTAAKAAAKDIGTLGTKGAEGARGIRRTETASKAAATGLGTASAAARANAAATTTMAASNRLAAGSMGNLVAQGNDVIQMLMAGQNPMQLAIQQGTQITQVIGPLGAAGAFRALGGAVMSMLSPINLITIGALAATAAVVNWFSQSSDEARSFEDSIEALSNRIDSLKDKIAEASSTRFELAERFGQGFVDRAQDILDRIAEAEKRAAQREARASINSFLGSTDLDLGGLAAQRGGGARGAADAFRAADGADASRLAREFGLASGLFGRLGAESRGLVDQVLNDLAGVQAAAEGTVEEQAAAVDALIESYTRAAQAVGDINEAERARLDTLDQIRIQLAETLELQRQDPAQNRQAREMAEFLELLVKSTNEQIRADQVALSTLATMQQQNALAQAIARFGADSAEVARLRAEAVRDAKLEMIDADDASEEIKEAMRDAAHAAFEIATTDMAGPIGNAFEEAQRLAAALNIAVEAARELQRITPDMADEDIIFEQPVIPDANQRERNRRAIENFRRLTRPRGRSGGAGGARRSGGGARRGGEEDRERAAVEKLIEAKNRELAVLRETDPVQREMIRLRERLTAATPQQREEVEALIEAHHAEIEAMERKEAFRDILGDVLINARSLKDVWDGIVDNVIRAAQEALIFGQGPLAGLFGGGGGGGAGLAGGLIGAGADLFSLFSPGALINFADGGLPAERIPRFASGGAPRVPRPGLVLGQGTGRSDSIRADISAGEFIVNARATQRNRALLEAVNAGAPLPGFAGGGLPLPLPGAASGSGAGVAGGAASGGGVTRLVIEPSELFRVIAEERARNVAVEVVNDFSAQQLPTRVEAIRRDPFGRG